ncbi:CDP-glycerol glycerophosphotransferase family protein [Nitrosopumilus sp. S4]
MSKIIFISETTDLKSFLEKNVTVDDIIIETSEEIKNELDSLGQKSRSINEFSKNSILSNKKSLEWIKSWPDKPIFAGKSFKEFLIYDQISIFWFLETRLYLYRIQGLINLIEQIKNIFSCIDGNSVIVKGNFDIFHIINEKFKDRLTSIEFVGNSNNHSTISQNNHAGHGYLKLIMLKLLRGFGTLKKKSNDRPILLITELANWREEYDYLEKKYIKRDVIFSSIIKKFSELSIPIRVIDFENQAGRLLKSFTTNKDREKKIGLEVQPWEKFITSEIISKTKNFNKKLEKQTDLLLNSTEFKKSLIYEDISLYKILKKDFSELLHSFKTYVSPTFIETAKRILDEINPSVLVMHDEYGTLQLCLINEASKRKIPSISIQHGVNTETWISYVHKSEHIKGKNSDLIFPIPNHICVWSEKAKNNLIKYGNFPSNVPIVTGDPKSDFLPKILKNLDSLKIKSSLGIPPAKNIILFATQTLSNLSEKSLITNSIFKCLSNMKNSFLVIKAHPNETNLSYYSNIAKKFSVKNFMILQSHNLYELIFISNVVIVPYSTVGIEAMRLQKPVIAMNMMGLHDDDPLIQSKIPIIVQSENELKPAIEKCLQTEYVSQIIQKGELFAKQEIGNIDGLASKRIIDLIITTRKNSITN